MAEYRAVIHKYVQRQNPNISEDRAVLEFIHNVFYAPQKIKRFYNSEFGTSQAKRRQFRSYMQQTFGAGRSEAQYHILRYMRKHHPDVAPDAAETTFYNHVYSTDMRDAIDARFHARVRRKIRRRQMLRGTDESVAGLVRKMCGDGAAVGEHLAASFRTVGPDAQRIAMLRYSREQAFRPREFLAAWRACGLRTDVESRAAVAEKCGMGRRKVQTHMRAIGSVVNTIGEMARAGKTWDEIKAALEKNADSACAWWIARNRKKVDEIDESRVEKE